MSNNLFFSMYGTYVYFFRVTESLQFCIISNVFTPIYVAMLMRELSHEKNCKFQSGIILFGCC
jgi:hypothetical protein